jgi:hypothetical protein
MRLVEKKDLRFIDDMLVDNGGEVLGMPALAAQANEIFEVMDLMNFLKENRAAIEATEGVEPLVYNMPRKEEPTFAKLEVPATPLRDEETERKAAIATEWLEAQRVKDVNDNLLRYNELARWFSKEYIELEDGQYPPSWFKGNILELTEDDVVQTVKDFHDPDLARLRDMIEINYV